MLVDEADAALGELARRMAGIWVLTNLAAGLTPTQASQNRFRALP